MASHTIIIPADISEAFNNWYQTTGYSEYIGNAMELLVCAGLTVSPATKAILARDHLSGGEVLGDERHTISMSDRTWEMVADYAQKYGLKRSEAFRELVRLGLGIPSPKPMRREVLSLADAGWQMARIAKRYGISRQAVHGIIQRARDGNPSIRSAASAGVG
jgi:hypothetical protein